MWCRNDKKVDGEVTEAWADEVGREKGGHEHFGSEMRRAWTLSDKSDESREDGLGELLRTLHAAININSAWPGNGRDPEAAAAAASTAASIHGQRWEARDAEALTTAAPLGHSYSWPSSAGEETLEAPCAHTANRRTSVPGAIGRMTRLEGANSLLKPTVAATLVTCFTRPACRTRTRRQLPRNGPCIPKVFGRCSKLAQLGLSLHTWSLAVALHLWLYTCGSAHDSACSRLSRRLLSRGCIVFPCNTLR
jgi:hypothetical protein